MRLFALVLAFFCGANLMLSTPALAVEPRTGLLLVAFGTSQEDARRAYATIEADMRAAFDDTPLAWAYTSNIIRNKLKKQGLTLFSIDEALDRLSAENVKAVRVQSLHVAAGEEFSYMERALAAYALRKPDRFDSITVGRPLLESLDDMNAAIAAALASVPKERSIDEALVFMGHGHKHGRGELVLTALRHGFTAHDPLARFAAVEGALTFGPVLEELKQKNVKRVWLQPFMIVSGEHAKNDLLGNDDDSWASQFKAAGIDVKTNPVGLGELAGIRALFVNHARTSQDNILKLKDSK